MKAIVLLFLSLFLSILSYGQEKVALPRDETASDASLAAFVRQLKKAIAAKDEVWIKSVLDKNAVSTHGDEEGVATFMQYWSPENDSTNFWPSLEMVVKMGGVFLHDTADRTGKYKFVFPYAYDLELGIEEDPYLAGVVTGENVNLRTAPNSDSEEIRQLSYNVIYFLFEDDEISSNVSLNELGEPEWYQVTTFDKAYRGWINWKYVYSLIGPRLFLYKDQKGQWRISAFVAGD